MFGTIIADPPWPYQVYSATTGHGRSAESHYPTMGWDGISDTMRLLYDVLAPDGACCLWVVPPSQDTAIDLMKRNGFRYVTKLFCWVKLTQQSHAIFTGMGFYTRANSEDVLLFIKDKTPARLRHDVKQVILTLDDEPGTPTLVAPRGRHSAKPESIQDALEKLFVGPYLEAFARRPRAGWTTIGNEIDELDIRDALARLTVGASA